MNIVVNCTYKVYYISCVAVSKTAIARHHATEEFYRTGPKLSASGFDRVSHCSMLPKPNPTGARKQQTHWVQSG